MYQITWKGNPAGRAEIHKEGMFYRFVCHCQLPDKGIYRVVVADGKNQYILGICVPDGNRYSCAARMPCNKLNGNNFLFTLTDSGEKKGLPIKTGKSFSHLDKLKTARLHLANGQYEIIIDSIQDPQDSDPNPIHQNK